ncbi:MAG: hypothetical protein JWN57_1416, partial [Frankiales bacterium]|nr:hypothetical protein [Frankiales bacterium]
IADVTRGWLVPSLLGTALSLVGPVAAVSQNTACAGQSSVTCGQSGEDDFRVIVVVQSPSDVEPEGASSVSVPGAGRRAGHVTEARKDAVCSGNGPDGGEALCPGAVSICPVEGQVAFWVWTRTRNTATGEVTPWVRVMDPPHQCLGAADDPMVVVPPEVAIPPLVERAFQSYPLERAMAVTEPGDETLVNVPTRFWTPTSSYDLPVQTLLGRRVHIRAEAQRYDWSFGDGATRQDAGPGAAGTDTVTHSYTRSGKVGPTVRITWGGTFTIEGIAQTFTIQGTATTQGQPTPLVVRTARSELVAG